MENEYGITKQVSVRLFFNRNDNTMYIMLGGSLFKIRDTIATAIQNKEKIEIVHVNDMQHLRKMISYGD